MDMGALEVPTLYTWCFVGGIVVQDEMDLLIGLPSNMEVQLVQEFQELSAAMPEVKLGIHRAGSHVQLRRFRLRPLSPVLKMRIGTCLSFG